MIEVVKVPAERAEELKKLSIEVSARKDIIQTMIQNSVDITSNTFKNYQNEFNIIFADYDSAKTKLQADFVDGKFENPIRWDLDFATGELKVELG